MIVKYRPLNITQFAQIDAAMLGVIRAVRAYESAIYSKGEAAEAKKVLNAAMTLRRIFLKIEREINHDNASNNTEV